MPELSAAEEAFLAAIWDDPDADAPRLFYADWLDEQGDSRGELMRVQCQLVHLDQTDPQRPALLERQRRALALFGRFQTSTERGTLAFHRGLQRVRMPAARFPAACGWLAAHRAWIDRIELKHDPVPAGPDEVLAAVAAGYRRLGQPPLSLELYYWREVRDDGLAALAGLKRLHRLDLHWASVTDAGVAHLAGLTGLRRLGLDYTWATDDALPHLAGLARLERLSLRRADVTAAGLRALVGLKRLRFLDLSHTPAAREAHALPAWPDCTVDVE